MLGSYIQSHSEAKVFKYSIKCSKTDITQAISKANYLRMMTTRFRFFMYAAWVMPEITSKFY